MCHIGTAHTRHQFATAIAPSCAPHLWSKACSCPCQKAIARQQAPGVGDGVVRQHVLTEPVPFGSVAQIEAVLTSLYGTEEDIEIHTAEEEHMTISGSSRCAAHYGLTMQFASAILTIHPYRCWRGTLPQGGICPTLLQFAYGHIHTIGVHCWRQTQGIVLRLKAAEDKQAMALGRVLHNHTGLQTALVGQGGSQGPFLGIAGPWQGVHVLVGHTLALTASHPQHAVVICGGKVVQTLWQRCYLGIVPVAGTIETALVERCDAIRATQNGNTTGHRHTGTIGNGIVFLLTAIGTGHIGKVASSPRPQVALYPTGIMPRYGIAHGRSGGDGNTVLSQGKQGTEQ